MALALSVLLLSGSALASQLRTSAYTHANFFSRATTYPCSLTTIPTNAPSTACQNISSGSTCSPLVCNSGFIPSTSTTSLVSILSLSCTDAVFAPTTYSCFTVPAQASLTTDQKTAIDAYIATLTPAQAAAFAASIGAGYSAKTSCTATCVNGTAVGCSGQTDFACSKCVDCSTRRQTLGGNVSVVCLGTTSEQTACFRAAVCAGTITTADTCVISSVSQNCPACNASGSKKGLLGLLGLLGLIPLLLLLSSSSLLCLLLLRRKKTSDAFYPVGTTEVAAPPLVLHQPTVVYEPHGTCFEPSMPVCP